MKCLKLLQSVKVNITYEGGTYKNLTWVDCVFPYRPDQIYHVTVMPCYDKKLEASREDFYNDIYRTRDVDCVISTGIILC